VIYFEMPDLPEFEDFFTSLPTTVVSTTWARRRQGGRSSENQRFHGYGPARNFWVKVTCPERMSVAGRPMTTCALRHWPGRELPRPRLWGTDGRIPT
jgi:2-pyrone-4,6-dicarboxylate lactonase